MRLSGAFAQLNIRNYSGIGRDSFKRIVAIILCIVLVLSFCAPIAGFAASSVSTNENRTNISANEKNVTDRGYESRFDKKCDENSHHKYGFDCDSSLFDKNVSGYDSG